MGKSNARSGKGKEIDVGCTEGETCRYGLAVLLTEWHIELSQPPGVLMSSSMHLIGSQLGWA